MNISSILSKRLIFQKPKHLPTLFKLYCTSGASEEKIVIPKRINRGPTDILQALESTISRDPTAAHYKYHDDPYLIPLSNSQKRVYAMAQESGRKAAHWIRREHADLFNHREAEPTIEAFLPRMVYNEKSKVTEDDLKKLIRTVEVSDASLVYKLLKSRGVEISEGTKQELLELMCYVNDEEPLSEEFVEERWFRQSSKGARERQRKTWKDGSLAEEIFISIENPKPETYAALIQGMSKYFQINRAWELYEEAKNKQFVLPTSTYNSLLKVVNYLKESYDLRWSLILNLLSDMEKTQTKPNLGTLNSILHSLSTMGSGRAVKDAVLQVLREFKDLDIEPSLGSWYYVLITFCKERGPVSTILHDIMNEVDNKDHKIRDLNDTYFFVTAMDISRNHLNDFELGKKVNKLLHCGNNYNLIGDSYKESIYYRHYFMLSINNMPFDEFITKVYEILVPNVYVPEPSVMLEVLNQVELNMTVGYLPKLWSDIIIFDHVTRENLVNKVLDIMIDNEQGEESELRERFSIIAWDVYQRIEGQSEGRINKLNFTGDLIGKIMLVLLRNNDFTKACALMDKLDKLHSSILGVPKFEALSLFVDHCIENKQPSRAIVMIYRRRVCGNNNLNHILTCIRYCADSGFPDIETLAAKVNNKLTLDEEQLNRLSKLIGNVGFASQISTN